MENNPLLLTVAETCEALRIGRTRFYTLRQSGAFGPKILALGGKLLVRADELRDWVAAGLPPAREWAWTPQDSKTKLGGKGR